MTQKQAGYKIDGREPTIFRVVKDKNNPYVMIDRRPVDNPLLSFKAKGILTYLLSRPDGWEVSVTDLVNHSPEGKASIRSGLQELEAVGHMKREASRHKGRITGWLIRVYEVPQEPESENRNVEREPESDFQDVENQDVENRTQVLSTLSNTENNNIKPSAGKPAKPPTPPEVKLYREVTNLYPPKINFEAVVKIIQSVSARIGRDCTADDLRPFFEAWTFRGNRPTNLNWTSWAVTGIIPTQYQPRNQQSNLPKGIEAGRIFLEAHGVNVNG